MAAATAKDQEMRHSYALSKLVPVSLMTILVLYTDRVIQFIITSVSISTSYSYNSHTIINYGFTMDDHDHPP